MLNVEPIIETRYEPVTRRVCTDPDAAARELWEETGVRATPNQYLTNVDVIDRFVHLDRQTRKGRLGLLGREGEDAALRKIEKDQEFTNYRKDCGIWEIEQQTKHF